MTEFTQSEKERLLLKTDKMYEKINDLCSRMVKVETNLENHLENQRTKFNKTTMVLGIVIAIVAVVAGLK